ncbi:hypothetical protein EG328_006952 [Venturia inaequalis]|uniref:C3H1-type domain-containing protein n=1 Tax=Venturia inaequalis TaxID=5025 RepID=A0A8H3UHH9_VENIN|nr:hypothetical protein EG328_006952 [Venturia inaequalis]
MSDSPALDAEQFDVRFGAIISKMDNYRMQMNGMNKDVLRELQKAANDFGSARIETAVSESNALKEQVRGLKGRLEELEDENKKLAIDYERLGKDHTRLGKELANVQDELRDSDKRNRDLEDKLSENELTLSQFVALTSRVTSVNASGSKRAAEDDRLSRSKKPRPSYDRPSEILREEQQLDSASRREFRDYSPSERPVHQPYERLRNSEGSYSSSGNAPDKVKDYLARLPTPSNTRDDNSSMDHSKTPAPTEDINIRGRASSALKNETGDSSLLDTSDSKALSLTLAVHIPTGPQHSNSTREIRRPDGTIEERKASKVWRRDESAHLTLSAANSTTAAGGGSRTMTETNGNASNDNRNTNDNDRFDPSRANREAPTGPANQLQIPPPPPPPPPQQPAFTRRRIVCHSCWEVRGRCDNRSTCGNCSADGVDCVRSICLDFQNHGVCPRGAGCFKVHGEQHYNTVTFSPFDHQENKRRYERWAANGSG